MFNRFLLFSVLSGTLFYSLSSIAAQPSLKSVTLSTSGLAQFNWSTTANSGTEILSLPVRRDQVDDVLKSLVVLDGKGKITGITLPGQESLDQLFKDLPFTQDDLKHPASLLQALKGQKVTISGPSNMTGRLITIHKRHKTNDTGTILTSQYVLSVMTADGLQQAVLENLDAVTFLDPDLNKHIDRGLAAIKDQSQQDVRTLSIALSGGETRHVGFSYVVEAPLWKAAYRIVLPKEGVTGGEALVQGWAVLENTTGGDWNNVDLTLISGNPVTFKQPLYDTYTVPRPTLPVQVFGKVIPKTDKGAYELTSRKATEEVESMAALGGMADMAYAPQEKSLRAAASFDRAAVPVGEMAKAQNMALAEETASQMLFSFPHAVTLKSGHTMMIPFINNTFKAKRIYLYQPEVEKDHPLVSLSFTNTTDTGMPPGIVTLYSPENSGPTYIGDAEMPLVEGGEDRMLSFAVDGKTNIQQKNTSETLTTKVAISGGIMRMTQLTENTTIYTIKPPKNESRDVIIEHPKRGGEWILANPTKGTKETKTHYRIPVALEEDKQKDVTVTLQRQGQQVVKIADVTAQNLSYYIRSWRDISDDTKKILSRLIEMRRSVDQYDTNIRNLEATKQRIVKDQERLRANLSSVPEKSDLAERYLDQMAKQEDQLDSIEDRVQSLQEKRATAMHRLKDFINDIEI